MRILEALRDALAEVWRPVALFAGVWALLHFAGDHPWLVGSGTALVPERGSLADKGTVDLIREATEIMLVLIAVNWAFMPWLDIQAVIEDGRLTRRSHRYKVEGTVRAAVIVGWFIFIGLLAYGLSMIQYT